MTGATACVTGVGVISALGVGAAATHAALCAGAGEARALEALELGGAGDLRGHPCAAPDAVALGVSRAELRYMPPAMRLLQAAAREALAQAGLLGDRARLACFGIAIGAHTGERPTRSELALLVHAAAPAVDVAAYGAALLARSPLCALRAQPGLLAGMLSQLHGTGGPALTIIDDAVGGARAIEEACRAVTDGWCEGWIAGGTFDLDDPWILLSRARDAPPLGSAAAVLILESASAARARGAPALAALGVERAARDDGADDALARSFHALRLVERLGDTLAAALPVSLALAVRHLEGAAGVGAGPPPRLTITTAGRDGAFSLAQLPDTHARAIGPVATAAADRGEGNDATAPSARVPSNGCGAEG